MTTTGIEQTPRSLGQISEDDAPSSSHSTPLPSTDGQSPLAHRWVENTFNIIKEIRLIGSLAASVILFAAGVGIEN